MAKAEAVKEVRRKQLIDATILAIGRVGYANATLTHVASEAGLSPGIVNFYFKSKEQLLIATLEQIAEEYSAFLQAAINKGKVAPAAGLEAMIEADFSEACVQAALLAAIEGRPQTAALAPVPLKRAAVG